MHVPPRAVQNFLNQRLTLTLKRLAVGKFHAAGGDHQADEAYAQRGFRQGVPGLLGLGEGHVDQEANAEEEDEQGYPERLAILSAPCRPAK